jgi:hypothetical protein
VNETCRAFFKLERAACVVRTFAFVATFIPMKPAVAEKTAPTTNATAMNPTRVDRPAVNLMDRSRIGEQSGRYHNEYAEHSPFGLQKCHRSVGDMTGKFLHLRVAGILLTDPGRLKGHNQQP